MQKSDFIINPKQRYSLINRQKLADLLGIKDNDQLSEYHLTFQRSIIMTPIRVFRTMDEAEKWMMELMPQMSASNLALAANS